MQQQNKQNKTKQPRQVSLRNPGYLGAIHIDQAGFKLRDPLSSSTSQMLESKV